MKLKTLSYLDVRYNSFEWYCRAAGFVCLSSGNFLRSYVATPSNTYRVTSAWSSDGFFYEFTVSFYCSRNICNRFIGKTPEQAYSNFKRMFDR